MKYWYRKGLNTSGTPLFSASVPENEKAAYEV